MRLVPHAVPLKLIAGNCILFAVSGCNIVLGIDEYTIDDGASLRSPASCGTNEIPIGDECEAVGVKDCGGVFTPNGDGGCTTQIPDGACGGGTVLLTKSGPFACGLPQCGSVDFIQNPTLNVPEAESTIWVRAGATGDGSSPTNPLGDLGAALGKVPGTPLNIVLGPGTYSVDPIVVDRPLSLQGNCTTGTVLIARRPDAPVIYVLKGMTLRAGSLSITGGSAGIDADGAEILLGSLMIHDIEGHGIRVVNATTGHIGETIVEAARDAGIALYGVSDFTITGSLVRSTRARSDADPDGGRGIAVYPAPHATLSTSIPEDDLPSTVHIDHTIVEGSREAGILVEGSNVDIADSVVRDTGADRDGGGRGIVVRPRELGFIRGNLDVTRTIIERSRDVGISIQSSSATISNTVVREVGQNATEDGLLPCLGNGIRVRFNRDEMDAAADAGQPAPSVNIESSLISGVRESAVHVEGGVVSMSGSILRDVSASCRDTGGDGVAVYDYPWSPATVTIDKTRIDSVRRSAIARFGGKVSAIDSTMACASGKAVASADALTLARSQCGCEDWTLCRPSEAKLSPALSGLDGCTAGAPCARYCFRDVTAETAAVANGGHAAGLELVMWEFDDDSVASEFARKNVDSTLACVDFGGLSPGEHRLAFGQGGVTQVQRGAGVVPSIGIVKTISENAGPHFMLPFAAEGSISSQRSSRAMFRSAHTPMKI